MDRGSQLSKDDEDDEEDEEEEEERRTRQEEAEEEEEEKEEKEEEATDIKSNNPHLAGGEQHSVSHGPCLMPKVIVFVIVRESDLAAIIKKGVMITTYQAPSLCKI